MRKLSIETEKVNMEYERYRFLFGFDNLVTVFQPYDYMNVTHNSKDYKVAYSFEHTCSSIEDVLMDLEVFVRTGNGKVVLNDVVGIKINGSVYCFRYLGMKNAQLLLLDGYHEVTNFIETEKNNLIREIHRENKVMSVLHGELIPIDKIEIEENLLYAIDGEMFKPTGDYGKGFTTTDYSLYCLEANGFINFFYFLFCGLRKQILPAFSKLCKTYFMKFGNSSHPVLLFMGLMHVIQPIPNLTF